MPTYQELRSTYGRLTIGELQDLALRPFELTAQAQAALVDELSSRGVPANADTPTPETRPSARADSWYRGWLTVFEAWVTLEIAASLAAFALLRPDLGWSTLLMLAIVAVPTIGLVLIANSHPLARRFWLALLAVLLVAWITIAAAFGRTSWRAPSEAAIIAAWYLYWLNSRRIAAEFSSASRPASPADA